MNTFNYLVTHRVTCDRANNNDPFKWTLRVLKTNSGICLEFAMMNCLSHIENGESTYLVSIGVENSNKTFSTNHIVCFYRDKSSRWVVENYVDEGIYFNRTYSGFLEDSIRSHAKEFIPLLIENCVPDRYQRDLNEVIKVADENQIMSIYNRFHDKVVSQNKILKELGFK